MKEFFDTEDERVLKHLPILVEFFYKAKVKTHEVSMTSRYSRVLELFSNFLLLDLHYNKIKYVTHAVWVDVESADDLVDVVKRRKLK